MRRTASRNAAIASGVKPAGGSLKADAVGSGFGLGSSAQPGKGKAGGPSEEEMAALQKMLGR